MKKCVSLSTTEAEYIVANEAGKEMLWLKRFIQELGLRQDEYVVFCDSKSAIDLSKNATYHCRTKHIDIRYHWLREVIENQSLKLVKIDTKKNPPDMMTKIVPQKKIDLCVKKSGMGSR